tara:strand:- start:2729 stop:3202 length:474 start_codon:yes stop_codon:yes gene_type:complete
MVNKMSYSTYIKFDEMLIVGFGLSLNKVKTLKKTRKVALPRNFMQMKIWKVLTEEQFNLLYTVLHNESTDIFIELAVLMNKEWKNTVGRYNKNKRQREYERKPERRKRAAAYGRKYREENKDKVREIQRRSYLKNRDKNRDKVNRRQRERYHKNKEK